MFSIGRVWEVFVFSIVFTTVVSGVTVIDVTKFGARAGDGSDSTLAVLKAINASHGNSSPKIIFPKGKYDFWPDFGIEKYCFISNNDEGLKKVAFPLIDFENIEVDGQGSEFVFHGFVNPFVIDNSQNVVLKNFSIDFERTFHSEAKILGVNEKGMDLEFTEKFPYEIQSGILVFTDGKIKNERKTSTTSRKVIFPYGSLLEFDTIKCETAFMAQDYWIPAGVCAESLGGRKVRILVPGIEGTVGNTMVFGAHSRSIPGILITDSDGINVESVTIYHCGGMGVIAQRSGNIKLEYVDVTPKPDSGRIVSVTADATHYVNCFGKIEMSHCLFECQKDDPSNIHGIYAKIVKKLADDEVIVQLVHPQQFGFDFIDKGEYLEIVHGSSLITYGKLEVKHVDRYNKEFTRVKFTKDLPKEFDLGDALAEIRDYPEVHIHDCKMRGNRARGFLLNCRGKTIIEDNYFSVPGAAILFEGDARFWFEQAGVSDCIIRNNVFDNCNYGVWGSATIQVGAGITDEYKSKSRYNRNIKIEGNLFRVFDDFPLLKAYSVDGLTFINNKIEKTNAYPDRHLDSKMFDVVDCDNVIIEKPLFK